MVGIVMTVVAGHGVYCTLDQSTLPTMAGGQILLFSYFTKKQYYSAFTETRATQTVKTNQKVEVKQ